MSVNYTENCNFEKPVIGNSYGVWGTEENNTIDLIDDAVFSNNFAENAASHSGLNFYYKNGRVSLGTTITNVAAGYVTLTDSITNYIEVDTSGTVSANTTGFTLGKMPLFTVVTLSGEILTVTDKRCYFGIPVNQFFTSDGSTITTNQQFTITGVLSTDSNSNLLINGATAETNLQGGISVKQGNQNPSTNSVDQLTIFATAGADSILGLVTENGISNNLLPVNINTDNRYIYTRVNSLNPIHDFITSTISVVNTTDETTILTLTLPGKSNPGGQLIKIKFTGNLTSALAAHQNSLKIYVGGNTNTLNSDTSSSLTNEYTIMDYFLFIKDDSSYAYAYRAVFGNYSWSGRGDYSSMDFTNDVVIKVTSTWNTADAGSQADFYAGCFEICV